MVSLKQNLRENATQIDSYINDYLNVNRIHEPIQETIQYALSIISTYRERAFIMGVIGRYLNVCNDFLYPLTIAAELIVLAAYIKDDMIDKSAFRAGGAAVHKKYTTADAVLASDVLISLSQQLILTANILPPHKERILSLVNKAYINLCEGQLRSLCFGKLEELTPDIVENIAYCKAGDLIGTFCRIPAIISANNEVEQVFYNYGKWFGVAMQFRNDFEDLFNEDKVSTDPLFHDLVYNQANIVLAYFSKNISIFNPNIKNDIIDIWNQSDQTPIDNYKKNIILDAFEECDVIKGAYTHFIQICRFAIESIKDIQSGPEKKQLLRMIKLVYS